MRATERTLSEQMRITDISIARRRKLLGLTDGDLHLLYSAKQAIDNNLEAIVDEFYERQTQIDEIALLIGDLDTMRRLRMAQCGYVSNLFSGVIDMEYINDRLRIGLVHKRIGVKPKLYLSGIDTLSDILWKYIAAHSQNQAVTLATLQALRKILHFDVTLVFDTYIRSLVAEVEVAVQRAETYALGLEAKVAERTQELERLSTHDSLTGLYNHRTLHCACAAN
ncbi:protoglobin domain-containing protein [Methylogaea oryzae]|uniref:protoglobin domain-containing protein n=1 Tax=Methylogaea oryzae TaxID=1295382 RepID=UPI0006D1B0A5|nr:protoglobin domain-containing protein [Methylogaea oryzae]